MQTFKTTMLLLILFFSLELLGNEYVREIKLSEEEKAYIQKKSVVHMCVDPQWLPYEKIEQGKHIGMAADYLSTVSTMTGLQFALVITDSWNQSVQLAKNRQCDIFSLAMNTPSRSQYMNFTQPYIAFPLVVATKLDTLFIDKVQDIINTKTLAIGKNYAFSEILKAQYPNNKLLEVENIQEGLEMVRQGKVFGFVGTLATVGFELQRNYIGELKIAGKFDETWDLSIGVRNDDMMLLSILSKAVASIDSGYTYELLNKWVSVKYEEKFDYELIVKLTIFFLIVIALFIHRNTKLAQFNAKIKKQAHDLEQTNIELEKTKQTLETSLQSIERIYDSMLDAVLIFENKQCIEVNNVAVKMFGYENKEQMKGLDIESFVAYEYIEDFDMQLLENTQPYEVKALKKDGMLFDVIAKGSNIVLDNKKVRISAIVDISEIKNKDKMLLQQTKMAAMGEMIGNIAHQWRQPLNIISTTTTGIKLKIDFGSLDIQELKNELDTVNHTVQHLSKTIDDFRNFFKSEKEMKRFSIQTSIEKNLKLLEGMFKMNDIQVVLGHIDDCTIQNYENEFIQAILNILNNAKDALLNKKSQRCIFIDIEQQQNSVVLSIKDNGGGVDENVISKIFEPYFTTKHKSNGTGIGLYMTHQIIHQSMQGKIEVFNKTFTHNQNQYKGALFVITLPLKP
jgi:PAS domain S-box-containing protein